MSAPSQSPIRVLVVDDEPAVIDAYRQIFGGAGEDVAVARRDLGAKLFGTAQASPRVRMPGVSLSFEAVFCQGAEAAVAAVAESLAAERPFAVAFLDMRMSPGPDGVWAASHMRELDPALEIAICTAYSDVDPGDIGGRVPPEDKLSYLQKPFHPHEVRQMAIALASKWRAERRVARLAYFDSLTGLPNREQAHSRLRSAAAAAQQRGRMLALMYLDLDNFKRINDTLGHGIGDEVLMVAAERLRDALRADDARTATTPGEQRPGEQRPGDLGRLGGDEFMVLLPEIADSDEAARLAERLISRVQEPMRLSKHTVVITPSVGIAIMPTDGADAETLLRHGDLAMYFAKRRAPGTFAFFDASMTEGALHRYTIEDKLRGALERGELSLHYQPQIEMATGNVTGMEALLRWTNPELGVVPPKDFIPVAEATGLIIPIGDWVLRTACAQAKKWTDEGLSVQRIAVNIANQQLGMHNFADQVASVLREIGLSSPMLELEVTESMVMMDEGLATQVLEELHAIGVSVAIDDFGTGYSNFQRLHHLAIDRLKLDRSFVRDLGDDGDDRAIAVAILSMARALKVDVVAEGVETFAQFRFLLEHQCSQCQGFLLSRALPPGEAGLLLQRAVEKFEGSPTQRVRHLFGRSEAS
jgi:predicted signal transduction protein with EAL and GGDEF domain